MAPPYYWWQTNIVYQIYPRSFVDSNNDGIGDLAGITSRLDYVSELGAEAIWISPIYRSPMADFGYDVSDYCDIDPIFGTLADFDILLAEAHRRGLKVLLDLVPNHTSDEHPWFIESRASRENPKRDWYIWRDPAPDGGPPNNWISYFGGGAWQFEQTTGQYYLHLFDPKQPDLNWRNPAVREAVYDAIRFWLERGVDGFRIDVIWLMIKDQQLRDNPINPDWTPAQRPEGRLIHLYDADQPEVHDLIREMRAVFDQYSERVMIGEIYLPIEKLVTYYGEGLSELHLPFNFQLILLPWKAQTIRQAIEEYEQHLPAGAWPNWVLGNHDQPRIASRIGMAQARVAQMLLLTLRGTPTCYYGDELGMRDVEIPPGMANDPLEKRAPGQGRDPCRTPMQWDNSPHAGFSQVMPWLPLGGDYEQVNVAAQRNDPTSMLALFRRLTALRRKYAALSVGSYQSVEAGQSDVLAYLREANGQRVLVALNLSDAAYELDLSGVAASGELLCATGLDRTGPVTLARLALGAGEGLIIGL